MVASLVVATTRRFNPKCDATWRSRGAYNPVVATAVRT
tara:strand:+ start:199 stop:312 length:114 start_codon:yes stop_codon:yes gene_type:complete